MVTAVEQLLSEQLRVLHCKVPSLSIVYKLGYLYTNLMTQNVLVPRKSEFIILLEFATLGTTIRIISCDHLFAISLLSLVGVCLDVIHSGEVLRFTYFQIQFTCTRYLTQKRTKIETLSISFVKSLSSPSSLYLNMSLHLCQIYYCKMSTETGSTYPCFCSEKHMKIIIKRHHRMICNPADKLVESNLS